MNKFDSLYKIIMEDLSSKRQSIPKIDQLSPKQFIGFLKEFLPLVKNGKVQLNDVQITEKIDGSAIRLLTINGEMFFESSYSGITTYDKVPFKNAGKFLYQNYSQLFHDIYELIKCDFKLIGELIWIDSDILDEKITPVCASYLTNKFGKYGGIIVFDILKIKDNTLCEFESSEKEQIFNMIYDLNNEDFSFHLMEQLSLNNNITFSLDINHLTELINKPEYNKEKFTKADSKIVEEIKHIQNNIVHQLSDIIDNTQGLFSDVGDLIEGIVLKINSSGNKYGIFSNGYKTQKEKYWNLFNSIEETYKEFLFIVFGYKARPSIEKRILSGYSGEELYNKNITVYYDKIQTLYTELINNNTLPKTLLRSQINMAKHTVDKLNPNISYKEFLNKYILK